MREPRDSGQTEEVFFFTQSIVKLWKSHDAAMPTNLKGFKRGVDKFMEDRAYLCFLKELYSIGKTLNLKRKRILLKPHLLDCPVYLCEQSPFPGLQNHHTVLLQKAVHCVTIFF